MSRAAIRYAKAILDNATASGTAQAVNFDMIDIASTVSGNKELRTFLASPVVKQDVKKAAVLEIFSNTQNGTKELFEILCSNSRFEILSEIATQYTQLYNDSIGVETAYVTTAVAITPEIEKKVLQKVAEFSTKKISIQNNIDPSIIGGFILRVGDKQFNASVAYKLNELKRELVN